MANKLCDSQGQLIGYIETVEKNMHDGLTRVILHTGHKLIFLSGDLIADWGGNLSIRYGGLNAGKKSTSAANTAAIKDVIFAPPATIVYWSDGSKTVVKCSEKDVFDPEKGWPWQLQSVAAATRAAITRRSRIGSRRAGRSIPGRLLRRRKLPLSLIPIENI